MSQIEALATPSVTRPASKRQAILDAAKRAFVRDGIGAVGIDAIAIDAGVSRQTVYNQIGDKDQLFVAVVEDVTTRSSALLMATLATFPDRPGDLQADLTDFAVRLLGRCMCDIDGRALSLLLVRESHRFPELFETWHQYGPGKDWPALAACFDRLARNGYLDITDASLAARHFMALINADLPTDQGPCVRPSEEALRSTATLGVSTFLRAFGARP
ncbi:TetR/AcrR family transcriptional regulator [uncultured Devosia sp.]|uniref:TetR/AcrR family transcriptional regulator n=1 Tax=uncultured Devosia sp. TaxID=211434 RepID=UPI0035C9BDA1